MQDARPHQPEAGDRALSPTLWNGIVRLSSRAALPYATRTEPGKQLLDVHVGYNQRPVYDWLTRVCHVIWTFRVVHTYFVFDIVLLRLVQMDLDESAAVYFDPDPLSHDLTGEHQVLEDGVVDWGQSTTGGRKQKQDVWILQICLEQN